MKFTVIAAAAALLSLQACREGPPVTTAGADPADPSAVTRQTTYRSVTGDARNYRIVEPKAWDQLNRDVAPKQK